MKQNGEGQINFKLRKLVKENPNIALLFEGLGCKGRQLEKKIIIIRVIR